MLCFRVFSCFRVLAAPRQAARGFVFSCFGRRQAPVVSCFRSGFRVLVRAVVHLLGGDGGATVLARGVSFKLPQRAYQAGAEHEFQLAFGIGAITNAISLTLGCQRPPRPSCF